MRKYDFVAIDFETATSSRMPCQLGVVIVENGEIVRREKFMFRPPRNRYDKVCTNVHGITPAMTKDKLEFDAQWEEVKGLLNNRVLVAHNMPFDMDVLVRVCERYKIDMGELRTLGSQCTCQLFDKRGLDVVCEALNIPLENHHDGVSDAEACARVFMAYLDGVDMGSLEYRERKKRVSGISNPWRRRSADVEIRVVTDMSIPLVMVDASFFEEKNVLVSGEFDLYKDRGVLLDRLEELGACVKSNPSRLIDFFIVGKGVGPSKYRRIQELREKGVDIEIIDEETLNEIMERVNLEW